jgi:hypothetical protein
LGVNEKELMEIAALVAKAAESKSTVSADFGCVKYGAPNISDWPDPRSGKETREFFEKLFEVSNQHFLFLGRERFSIVAILVESSAPDQVLEALAKKAKEAADQCSPHNSTSATMDESVTISILHRIRTMDRSYQQQRIGTISRRHRH